MMQARMQGAKGWYRPDRDLIDALPKLIRKTIEILTERYKESPEDLEMLGGMAIELGKTIERCKDKGVTHEQLDEILLNFGGENEAVSYLYAEFYTTLFRLSVQVFRKWALEMIPDKADGTVDKDKLAQQNQAVTPVVEP